MVCLLRANSQCDVLEVDLTFHLCSAPPWGPCLSLWGNGLFACRAFDTRNVFLIAPS